MLYNYIFKKNIIRVSEGECGMRRYIDVLWNTKIARFIHRHKNWFITILFPIVLTAIIEYQTGYLGDKLYDCFGKLEYEEGIITPYYYKNSKLSEVREYMENYGKGILDEGCVLNLFVYNTRKNPIMISKATLIVDDIKEMMLSKIYIIGMYTEIDNEFELYAINNGLESIRNSEVKIDIDYYSIDKMKNVELGNKELEIFLNGSSIVEIDNLSVGEIRKFTSYRVNKTMLQEGTTFRVKYSITYESNGRIESFCQDIGGFDCMNSQVSFRLFNDFGEDQIIERDLLIDTDTDKGRILNIPANFLIEGNDWKNVRYFLYPTSSCELTFHAKLKCAGRKKEMETEKFTQKIYVPIYKEEDGFFYTMREFIEKYDIDTYYYNSNFNIQKEIIYTPTENNQKLKLPAPFDV